MVERLASSSDASARASHDFDADWLDFTSLSVSYSVTPGAIERVSYIDGDNVMTTTYENLARKDALGMKLSARFNITDRINLDLDASASRNSYRFSQEAENIYWSFSGSEAINFNLKYFTVSQHFFLFPVMSAQTRDLWMEPVLGIGSSATLSKNFFQEDYEYAGFPGTSGNGSYFTDSSDYSLKKGYGIMTSSEHKEAAWDFLRLLLLPENQEYGGDLFFGIPVTRAAFEKLVDKSIHEDTMFPEDSFTREDADKLRELVYSTEKMARQDDTLTEIISTEASAYFAGDKSLEDTVKNIQSRASIYVAEQAG